MVVAWSEVNGAGATTASSTAHATKTPKLGRGVVVIWPSSRKEGFGYRSLSPFSYGGPEASCAWPELTLRGTTVNHEVRRDARRRSGRARRRNIPTTAGDGRAT